MIRARHLIPKDEFFSYLEKSGITKILLYNKRNRALKNDNLCDVHIYYEVEFKDIATIIGACKVVIDKDGREGFLRGSDHAFLNGIQSQKQHGFLSKSMILKLMQIETTYDVNLSISQKIKEIIEVIMKLK